MRFIQAMKQTAAALALLAVAAASAPAEAQSQNESSWDQISRTGVLRVGVMPARPPYMWQKAGEQEWHGFSIEMGRQVAEALENENALGRSIEIEYVPTTWGTVVLDIQANKLDVFLGMSITEERKKAIAMYGPLYALAHVYINREGFSPGDKWEDYNKPEVVVAATTGTTDEAAARKLSPSATFRSHRQNAETILAVQAGRADAMITSVLAGLDAMRKNPNMARMVIPKPIVSLPSGGGARMDGDGRLHAFLQGWAYMSRASGNTKKLILDAVKLADLDPNAIPPEMDF